MPDPIALSRKIREALAPCSLGCWPTPLERLDGLDLWVKREDRSSPRAGGSKVRGLEFLLAGAAQDTVFVTVGGTGSTHCLLTAVHAGVSGYRSALAQFPQPDTAEARAVAASAAAAADVVERAGSLLTLPGALARAWMGARRLGVPRWIPGGGAHPRAVVGHFLGALELAGQVGEPPDAVVLPLGTGGTAAGVALGLGWLGWPTRVVGVRVAPWWVANLPRTWTLLWRAALVLRRIGLREARRWVPRPDSVIVVDAVGAGYGHPTADGERARREAGAHGLALESTYGAKAFGAIPAVVRAGFRRLVFWHTFAPPSP